MYLILLFIVAMKRLPKYRLWRAVQIFIVIWFIILVKFHS